jgi:vancomycin resistance protein YoaR
LPDVSAGALTVRVGGATHRVPYTTSGRDYDIGAMLSQALTVGRDGSIVDELRTLNHGAGIDLAITWDDAALVAALDEIFADAEVAPVNATITRDGARYVVVPASAGVTFDREAAYRVAVAAVSDPGSTTASITSAEIALPPAVSTAEAQKAVDGVEDVVGSPLVLSAADQTTTVPSDVLRGWVSLTGSSPADWGFEIDEGPVAQSVSDLALAVDVAPTNASFEFRGHEATVVDGTDGQAIDQAVAVSTIVDALRARADGGPTNALSFSMSSVAPEFSSADAQALVSKIDRLGRWTTRFKVSPLNGMGQNIRRPAQLINGVVVQPGQKFDFIDAAGPFTKRNGYEDGAAIVNGQSQLDGVLGGGLCSTSTTLFNAALRAGFQIDERHNHSFYIDRYPVGLDATIWQNGRIRKSMQFTNDSQYPILIRASYRPGRVTFEIWGVPDGRTVKFTKPEVTKEKEAQNFVEYTDNLPPGVIKHVEFRSPGFDSVVSRTVYDATGAVIHENTFYSDCIRVNGVYEVGRYPGDPRHGTKIPAAEWAPTGPPQPEPEQPPPGA